MIITLLTDDPNSWIIPYVIKLYNILKSEHDIIHIYKHSDIRNGDILFLLGCTKIFKKLDNNKHNIVIHESNLPSGKGWSPLTWQILEGKNKIIFSLFEAINKVDAGKIYLQDSITILDTDLLYEIKDKQGKKTIDMVINFINNYDLLINNGKEQYGLETFYKKRTPKNSELDINKSIKEQFNLIRVCDNERYPAFFYFNNVKYKIKIYKDINI